MNARWTRTILAIVVGLGILAVVGLVAYNVGLMGNGARVVFGFGQMPGYGDDLVFRLGSGWLSWNPLPMILALVGIVLLLPAVSGGWGQDRHSRERLHPATQAPMPATRSLLTGRKLGDRRLVVVRSR